MLWNAVECLSSCGSSSAPRNVLRRSDRGPRTRTAGSEDRGHRLQDRLRKLPQGEDPPAALTIFAKRKSPGRTVELVWVPAHSSTAVPENVNPGRGRARATAPRDEWQRHHPSVQKVRIRNSAEGSKQPCDARKRGR